MPAELTQVPLHIAGELAVPGSRSVSCVSGSVVPAAAVVGGAVVAVTESGGCAEGGRSGPRGW